MVSLLKTISYFITNNFDIKFNYYNGIEFLLGIVITEFLSNIIERIIYKTAYYSTALSAPMVGYNNYNMKMIHWMLRIILGIMIFSIISIPAIETLISTLVYEISKRILDLIILSINNFSSSIVTVLIS